ncbi:MAG: hypothetical protein HC818_02615, partial [Synechococcaceae cyanobacterium RM1_1_27]|nr:hypothetical protein [Synechococcaceae cyanobacterium RM1_1_27]
MSELATTYPQVQPNQVSPPQATQAPTQSFVGFRLGSQVRIAVEQHRVREAIPLAQFPITKVPGISSVCTGILLWRGQFLWAVDLGALFKRWDAQFSLQLLPYQEGLVIQGSLPWVLLIHERETIVRISPQQIKPISSHFRHHALFPAWIPSTFAEDPNSALK